MTTINADTLRQLIAQAKHPDSCPQSVPGAAAMARVYTCNCAIGKARAALEK